MREVRLSCVWWTKRKRTPCPLVTHCLISHLPLFFQRARCSVVSKGREKADLDTLETTMILCKVEYVKPLQRQMFCEAMRGKQRYVHGEAAPRDYFRTEAHACKPALTLPFQKEVERCRDAGGISMKGHPPPTAQ
jgi:hypothetical protein